MLGIIFNPPIATTANTPESDGLFDEFFSEEFE
jgi:hypothetical protein